jgi:hypothetical protein
MTNERKEIGKKFLMDCINWDAILQKLFLLVYKSICKDTNLKQVNFIQEVNRIKEAAERIENIDHIIVQFSDLNSEAINYLINQTKFLIEEINIELTQFRFEVDQTAVGIFHEIVLMLFWNLFTVLEHYKAYEPMRINTKCREMYKERFISVLTNDSANIDKAAAALKVRQMTESIYKSVLTESKRKFQGGIEFSRSNFEPINSMTYLDDIISKNKDNIKVVLEFMLSPKSQLEKIFEQKYEVQSEWGKKIEEKLKTIKNYFESIMNKLKNENLLIPTTNVFKAAVSSSTSNSNSMVQK